MNDAIADATVSAPLPPQRLPRAVLFDWDNTLVTNWRCVHAAINAALERFGHRPWTLEESYGRVRHSLRDSFPAIFGDDWMAARDVFYAHFQEHHLDYLEPLPGAAELLEQLSGTGIYLGVVSNKTGSFLRAEADSLGWTRHFGKLVGATDAAADKPSVAPVEMALEPGGIVAGPDVWFVGDADIDMECAHRSGCLPILVGCTPDVAAGLGRFPPAVRLDGCSAISALVQQMRDTISLDGAPRMS
ncbi:HAD family hydrolase [Rhodospirillum centenum]|uniref:phosphoglycolate phosphatase n=1 Tax=Rhodospirillum centenum (strain ATCC 51521 / SW) TaxID=414684 RepID=B6IQ47_RHOCS|nr:HAD family hydrolase [Rhodospirillum centenum]ACI97583.1 HAD-superfamily hydrolase, subfamily IA [Rhodospirillum centenum SW]